MVDNYWNPDGRGIRTWEMEKFVSSHGVNTAAVVGFEADAMQPDAGNSGNPT